MLLSHPRAGHGPHIKHAHSSGGVYRGSLVYAHKTPPKNKRTSPPWKVFAEYLLKVNFSEKVRYDRDDRLAELVHFLIANFLRKLHLQKQFSKNLLRG